MSKAIAYKLKLKNKYRCVVYYLHNNISLNELKKRVVFIFKGSHMSVRLRKSLIVKEWCTTTLRRCTEAADFPFLKYFPLGLGRRPLFTCSTQLYL